jgi:tRNA threonylcarbamoyladenosine biosynthesis protein TsaE
MITTDEIVLDTPADTEALGERLAAELGPGDLVVLAGPLGAGKTVFVRGLARGLGVTGAVTSPTFVIAREHRPGPGGRVPLVHVDAYRLGMGGISSRDELDDLDLDTDLAEAVVAVEWGEGLAERLAESHVLVRLERRPDDVRTAVVTRVVG